MSGHLYCAAIAARCNLLPTRVRGTRGKSREGRNRNCDCDCCGPAQFETLSHISQVCPRAWGPRNRRHNIIADRLARCLEKKGFTVIKETKIPSSQGNYKPDLIAFTDQQAVVIDVTVSADNLRDPNSAHFEKVEKYSTVEEISTFVEVNSGCRPFYSALAVNWRGVISPQSALDMKNLGLTNQELKLLSMITVEQTAIIHRHFHQSTYRVKLNRRRTPLDSQTGRRPFNQQRH